MPFSPVVEEIVTFVAQQARGALPPRPALELNLFASVFSATNVLGFPGADASGVLDSTAAFNAAIVALPANSQLQIPAGTFTINSALLPIPTNCTVVGAGEFSTIINTSLASGNLFTLSGAQSAMANLAIANANAGTTATAISMSGNQTTVSNVSITGFLNGIVMTSGATFGNVFNAYISSTIASSFGLTVAGSDTLVSGCQFNSSGQMIGMLCNANDRFAATDCVFKSNLVGTQLNNTSSTGSTSISGCTFDACTTGVLINPGASQSVQNLAIVGFTIDSATTGISVAPTSSGTVVGIDFDGIFLSCTTGISVAPTGTATVQGMDFDGLINAPTTGIVLGGSSTGAISDVDIDAEIINYTTGININPSAGAVSQLVVGESVFDSTTASCIGINIVPSSTGTVDQMGIDGCIFRSSQATAQGIVVNGAASSVGSVIVDACNFKGITGAGNAITYTAGALVATPIMVANSNFSTSVNGVSPNLGSANTSVFSARGNNGSGVGPVGKTGNQPAVATGPTTNNMGADVTIYVVVGGTATTISVGGNSIGAFTSQNVAVRVPVNQTITLSQTTAVTWTWVAD